MKYANEKPEHYAERVKSEYARILGEVQLMPLQQEQRRVEAQKIKEDYDAFLKQVISLFESIKTTY